MEVHGLRGLASHGGTLGLMLALWLYRRKTGLSLWQVLDDIAIATPVTACLIRLGNLMNSEILGRVTDLPWGFYFVQAGPEMAAQPRHPGQLYEAIAYFIFFFVGWWLYRKHPQRVGSGYFFGLCLTLIFTFRFFIEFTKDIQVSFESSMPLDMGQILSIPFVVLVVVFATIGADLGAMINYAAAYYLGRPLIYSFARSKWGRMCLLNEEKVQRSEKYFADHGVVATLTGRLLPVIRQLISVPAGLAKMNFGKFILYTTIGAGVWNTILAALGWYLHSIVPESQLEAKINEYSEYIKIVIVAAVVIVAAYFAWKKFKKH